MLIAQKRLLLPPPPPARLPSAKSGKQCDLRSPRTRRSQPMDKAKKLKTKIIKKQPPWHTGHAIVSISTYLQMPIPNRNCCFVVFNKNIFVLLFRCKRILGAFFSLCLLISYLAVVVAGFFVVFFFRGPTRRKEASARGKEGAQLIASVLCLCFVENCVAMFSSLNEFKVNSLLILLINYKGEEKKSPFDGSGTNRSELDKKQAHRVTITCNYTHIMSMNNV